MSLRIALAGVVAALTLVVPSSASAADFCIGVGAHCPSGATPSASLSTLASSINLSSAPGPHRIFVAPGETPGGALFMKRVEIIGSGVGTTTITAPGSGRTITLGAGGSIVRDLTVRVPVAAASTGVHSDGSGTTLERVRLTAASSVDTMRGVWAAMGGTLRDVTIDFPNPATVGTYGVMLPHGTLTVSDSRITAGNALDAAPSSGAAINVVRSRLEAVRGIRSSDGPVNVSASSLRVLPASGAFGVKIGGGIASMTGNLHGLTISGASEQGIGIWQSAVGSSSVITLNASDILFAGGLERPFRIERMSSTSTATTAGQVADFAVPDRFVDSTGTESWLDLIHTGGVSFANRRFVDGAALRDLAGGDLRPRIDSGLVDTGGLAALPGWAGVTDLLAGPRTADGDRDGTAVRDIGAVEYAPQAPVVSATAAPGATSVGDAILFTARVTDDPGDQSTVRWSFDDGTSATGASVRKAFAAPGAHRATATATDSTGLTGSGAATSTVSAPPAPTAAPPPAGAAATAGSGDGAVKATVAKCTFGRLATLRLRRGAVSVPVRCDGASSVTVTLRTAGRKPFTLGRASLRLSKTGAKTVKVKLSKAGLRRARRARTTKVVVALRRGKAAETRRAAKLRR